MTSDIFIEEARQLPDDLNSIIRKISDQIMSERNLDWSGVEQIYLVGNGDSYFACISASLVFEEQANIQCKVIEPTAFIKNEVESIRRRKKQTNSLLISVSVSGGTEGVLEAVSRAKEMGMRTFGVSCNPSGLLASLVDDCFIVELENKKKSPGIRTYQASLAMLYGLAFSAIDTTKAKRKEFFRSLENLASDVSRVLCSEKNYDRLVSDISSEGVAIFLGSGYQEGTAGYCASKLLEGAGIVAIHKTFDAWWHGERFIRLKQIPVIIFAPETCEEDYQKLLEGAHSLKKNITVVSTATGANEFLSATSPHLRPFLDHLFIHFVAAKVCLAMNANPFQSNPTDFLKGIPNR